MPGSVSNAAATSVMPKVLCSAFRRSQDWAVAQISYRNGEIESRARVTNERRTWELAPMLTAAQLSTLKAFLDGVKHGAFYFYDLYFPVTNQPIGSNYDASGASTTGRFTVRVQGGFQQQMNTGRFSASLILVEVS